ncbi:MAG TPA: hypothetical protein VG621_02985 [Candidatus Paceibacterota bacterium]|nr:hypothetical protein [Candidatus Paceibacterota bacterium]
MEQQNTNNQPNKERPTTQTPPPGNQQQATPSNNQSTPPPQQVKPAPALQERVTDAAPSRKGARTAGIIVALIVVLALVGNAVWKHKAQNPAGTPSSDQAAEGCAPGALFSTTGKPCPQSSPTDLSDAASGTAAVSGYDDAIHQYAGKVIVFDASCAALPAQPTFDSGTRILVANNSTTTLTLSVAGTTKTLSPYHYFTVPLTTTGSVVATCNGAPAATITVK